MASASLPGGRRKVTPPKYAHQLGVDVNKVLGWIRSGELRAINIAANTANKPRYAIDLADIAIFEAARAVQPPTPSPRRRRRSPEGVIEFFR